MASPTYRVEAAFGVDRFDVVPRTAYISDGIVDLQTVVADDWDYAGEDIDVQLLIKNEAPATDVTGVQLWELLGISVGGSPEVNFYLLDGEFYVHIDDGTNLYINGSGSLVPWAGDPRPSPIWMRVTLDMSGAGVTGAWYWRRSVTEDWAAFGTSTGFTESTFALPNAGAGGYRSTLEEQAGPNDVRHFYELRLYDTIDGGEADLVHLFNGDDWVSGNSVTSTWSAGSTSWNGVAAQYLASPWEEIDTINGDRGTAITVEHHQGHPLQPVEPAVCQFQIRDLNRQWDLTNTAAPHYPDWGLGTHIRVMATHDSVEWPIFHGTVSQVTPRLPSTGSEVLIDVECHDMARHLTGARFSADLPEDTWGDTDPESLWYLDEASGTAVDSGTNAVDGSYQGGPTATTWTDGDQYGATALDSASSQYISVPGTGGEWDTTADLTMAWWVRMRAGSVTFDVTNSEWGFAIEESSGAYEFIYRGNNAGATGEVTLTADAPLRAETWHHVAFVRDGTSTVSAFVDGCLEADAVDVSGITHTSGTGSLLIGRRYSAYSDGDVAYVGFWDRELSSVEVANLADSHTGTFPQEDPHERVHRILDTVAVAAAARDVEVESQTLDVRDPSGETLQAELDKLALSRLGRTFVDRSGRLAWHDGGHDELRGATWTMEWKPGAVGSPVPASVGSVPFTGGSPTEETAWLRTVVIALGLGGGRVFRAADGVASALYGRTEADLGELFVANKDPKQQVVNDVLERLATKRIGSTPLVVHPDAFDLDDAWTFYFSVQFGDRLLVTRIIPDVDTAGVSEFEVTVGVTGLRYELGRDLHRLTVSTAPWLHHVNVSAVPA